MLRYGVLVLWSMVVPLLGYGCASTAQSPAAPTANDVDGITSKADVTRFWQTHGPSEASSSDPYGESPCDTMGDRITRYFKVDLNDDGRTDLIINGSKIVYVMVDNGDGSFRSSVLRRSGTRLLYVRDVVRQAPQTLIIVDNVPNACFYVDSKPWQTDTLVVIGTLLMDQNPTPSTKTITSVTMVANGCYGFCAKYRLYVDGSGRAQYEAREYCDTTGEFVGIVDVQRAVQVSRAVQYLDPLLYPDQMYSAYQDISTFQFTFTYADGSTKSIATDLVASSSLASLITYLDDIRTSLSWRKK